MAGKTTPLYVVCSPCRCVGKTLLSRLLADLYLLADRPVAAFDLSDEGPQLSDYLPSITTTADIGEIGGQMALFEQLLNDGDGAKIIDVSHRTFKSFFAVVHEIGFFEEARRRSIEPLILFIVDPDPKAPTAYAGLRRRFTEASLLPVHNRTETGAISNCEATAGASMLPDRLEIPALGFSLQALIDRPTFSFHEFWQATTAALPDALDDELRDWIDGIFLQLRCLEFSLGCEDAPMQLAASPSRRKRELRPLDHDSRMDVSSPAIDQRSSEVPFEVLKFAPKKMRRDGVAMDQSGDAIVGMLQDAGRQLRAAEERINELETQIERVQDRAVRAETWLQLIGREVEEKLVGPATATRSKIDDLGR